MNCAPANVSERELRDVFLFPFHKAIEAGADVETVLYVVAERLAEEGCLLVELTYPGDDYQLTLIPGGDIDKFVGDAVVAFWGAPEADPDQAKHAVRAMARDRTRRRRNRRRKSSRPRRQRSPRRRHHPRRRRRR